MHVGLLIVKSLMIPPASLTPVTIVYSTILQLLDNRNGTGSSSTSSTVSGLQADVTVISL